MPYHFQPHDQKRYVLEDVMEWVQRVSKDGSTRLPTLAKMSLRDLTVLMLAMRDSDKRAHQNEKQT
jgi:hypothetical protein